MVTAPPIVESGLSGPDAEALEHFRSFLRLRTISGEGPRGSYHVAAQWLVSYCREAFGNAATIEVIEPVPKKPIVIVSITGRDPSLPCIILNSHYDVVPVMREKWCCDPFAAEIRDGYVGPQVPDELEEAGPCVYARGSQDMKNVCIQYVEALRRLMGREGGWRPLRTMHLTYVPDEECGGADGMGRLLETPEFEALKPIAFALDEGLASPRDAYTVFYGERLPWWILVRAEGPTGHGSRFVQNTAVMKLMGVINRAHEFRRQQEESLGWDCHAGCKHSQARKLGDVTTLNCTMLKGGVSCDGGETYALNVIPTEAEAGFDVRISPNLATQEFKEKLDEWCSEEGLSWKFAPWTAPLNDHFLTDTNRETSPFWAIFEDAVASTGAKVEREVFPAATDSRFLRAMGIQAIGFSPLRNTPILLHEHNEALSVSTFVSGIATYEKIIEALSDTARLPKEEAAQNGASTPKEEAAQNGASTANGNCGEPATKKAKTG